MLILQLPTGNGRNGSFANKLRPLYLTTELGSGGCRTIFGCLWINPTTHTSQAFFSARSHASSLDLLFSGSRIYHQWILTTRRNALIKTVLNRPNLSFKKPYFSHICAAFHMGYCTSSQQSSEPLN